MHASTWIICKSAWMVPTVHQLSRCDFASKHTFTCSSLLFASCADFLDFRACFRTREQKDHSWRLVELGHQLSGTINLDASTGLEDEIASLKLQVETHVYVCVCVEACFVDECLSLDLRHFELLSCIDASLNVMSLHQQRL